MQIGWRERRIDGGDFTDVFVNPIYIEKPKTGVRKKKIKETPEAQKRYNRFLSRCYMEEKIHANVDASWHRVHLTYLPECYPDSVERAKKDFRNYIARLKRVYKKAETELRAFWVSHCGETGGKIHFHLLVSGGTPYCDIISAWGLGRVSVDDVQFTQTGIADCAEYYGRAADAEDDDKINDANVWKQRWGCTRNLKEPVIRPKRDHVYRNKDIKKMFDGYEYGGFSNAARKIVESKYPGYTLAEMICYENPLTQGRYVRLKLHKTDTPLLAWLNSRNHKTKRGIEQWQ